MSSLAMSLVVMQGPSRRRQAVWRGSVRSSGSGSVRSSGCGSVRSSGCGSVRRRRWL